MHSLGFTTIRSRSLPARPPGGLVALTFLALLRVLQFAMPSSASRRILLHLAFSFARRELRQPAHHRFSAEQ